MVYKRMLAGAVAALATMAAGGAMAEQPWEPGWAPGMIKQSFVPLVEKDEDGKPVVKLDSLPDHYISRWLDTGKTHLSSDPMFLFPSKDPAIFRAGTAYAGALRVPEPGTYRIVVYENKVTDAKKANPTCRLKLAVDGGIRGPDGGVEPLIWTDKLDFADEEAAKAGAVKGASPPFVVPPHPEGAEKANYLRIDGAHYCDRDGTDAEKSVLVLAGDPGAKEFEGYDGFSGDAAAEFKARVDRDKRKAYVAKATGVVLTYYLENMANGEAIQINGENMWHRADAPGLPKETVFKRAPVRGGGAFASKAVWLARVVAAGKVVEEIPMDGSTVDLAGLLARTNAAKATVELETGFVLDKPEEEIGLSFGLLPNADKKDPDACDVEAVVRSTDGREGLLWKGEVTSYKAAGTVAFGFGTMEKGDRLVVRVDCSKDEARGFERGRDGRLTGKEYQTRLQMQIRREGENNFHPPTKDDLDAGV